MRDTRKSLLISGGAALVGALMIAAGAVLVETQGESAPSVILLAVGFGIGPIAAFFFIGYCVSGFRKEALEQGKDEIARWKLTPAEWDAFRKQDARWHSEGRGPNLLHDGAYRDGEVIFATKAVIADGDYHDLIPGGLVDLREVEYLQGSPSGLEFSMRAQKGRGASGTGFGFHYLTLRIPVAPGDTREAMKVLAHYKVKTRRGVALAMIKPGLTIWICIGVAVVCGIAALWGFSNTQTHAYGDAPLYAAVVGVILGGGSLLLAAIVAYRVRVLKG
jgi:hypothetical protein